MGSKQNNVRLKPWLVLENEKKLDVKAFFLHLMVEKKKTSGSLKGLEGKILVINGCDTQIFRASWCYFVCRNC
ncbi:MAG: hypothetical protein Ct9H300mP23_06940 [Nitrospinota bacterium]|nr:MAG: hypothetical protein Ct9H300mP23_06940 [Nitrospinota bacterium]